MEHVYDGRFHIRSCTCTERIANSQSCTILSHQIFMIIDDTPTLTLEHVYDGHFHIRSCTCIERIASSQLYNCLTIIIFMIIDDTPTPTLGTYL